VPKPAVSLDLSDRAVETVGPMSQDVAGVHVKPFEHCFAWPGQLLDRVENGDFFSQTEVFDQSGVGGLVNSGLESAEIDGDPVGRLVVQGLQHTLS